MKAQPISKETLLQILSPESAYYGPPTYIVYDTETLGQKQKEFFSWLNRHLPRGTPRTPEALLAACQPQLVASVKTYKNGKQKAVTEKIPYALTQEVVDYCNFIAGTTEKPSVKPGIGLFKKAWKTFDMEALDPQLAKVHNIQIGLLYPNSPEGFLVYYYTESAVEPETLRLPVEAMFNSKLPIICQNIDFDLRMTLSTFGLHPHQGVMLYDTMINQCLFNADGNREEGVSLADLCATYAVPEEFTKTGVSPQFIDWRDPGEEALRYAVNDILSVAYIFMCQQSHLDWPTIQPTLALESSVRDKLSYASIKGVPAHNEIVKALHELSIRQVSEALEVLRGKAVAAGIEGSENWTATYLGTEEFRSYLLNLLNFHIDCAGVVNDYGKRVKPILQLDKKAVYTHPGYQIFTPQIKELLAANFRVSSCKKRVNGLSKLRNILSPDGITWLHPTYGTVPKPSSAKTSKWSADSGAGGGTKSGRMSTRGELSPLTMNEVDKQIVVAPQGQFIFSCDLSGIELRVAASLSHDETLIDIINTGKDPYRMVASKAFGIPYDSISKKSKERALGKEAVLAFIFEAMPFAMINQILNRTKGEMRVEDDVAQALYEAWWSLAPTLKKWSHDNWVMGCVKGLYTTAKGRMRRFNMEDFNEDLEKAQRYGKTLYHPHELVLSSGESFSDNDTLFRAGGKKYTNLCSNHEVQTTAGEGFKQGLSNFPLREYGWGVIGFIHDDDTLLLNDADKSWAIDWIPYTM